MHPRDPHSVPEALDEPVHRVARHQPPVPRQKHPFLAHRDRRRPVAEQVLLQRPLRPHPHPDRPPRLVLPPTALAAHPQHADVQVHVAHPDLRQLRGAQPRIRHQKEHQAPERRRARQPRQAATSLRN